VWAFTPVFQALFLVLAAFYALTGDIGIAIILLTIALRLLLIPLFRSQIVSTRRMQMLQPELRALQQRFKGDRARISQEQMRLYKERGVNPAAGCLPAFLQLALLLPMYQVIREGLAAPIIEPMLRVFGSKVIDVACHAPSDPLAACINPVVHWLFNLDASRPEILVDFGIPIPLLGIPLGISVLALLSALLQLVQTRMVMPQTDDPQQRAQQRTFLFLPLFSLLYGTILPAGLFIYWIVTTVFSIAQQYLIVGWGSLFPLFGWTPSFAAEHTPRFPVAFAPVGSGATPGQPAPPPRGGDPLDRAAGTVRPSKQRGRTSRRGRRR
jgi:YidC/Oxa1 family membrane protein insertase